MTLSIILIAVGYLMGSMCSAIIVCRSCNLPDPRQEGSKNPGATNVLRIAGKKYAALVLLFDLLKGTIPVTLVHMFHLSYSVAAFTALAAVIGHVYPVFFDFKGGKGVATAIGALLGFNFIVGVVVIATWLLVANLTRYSSLASLIAITLSPLYSLLIVGHIEAFPPLLFMVVLIIFQHRNNITRLFDGVEPKIKIKNHTSVIEEIMDDTKPVSAKEHTNQAQPEATSPVKPSKPTKPAKTAKSDTSVKPAKTTKTGTSAGSVKPTKTAKSDVTAKPAKTAKAGTSATPTKNKKQKKNGKEKGGGA